MKTNIPISIVIAVKNEEKNLGRCLNALKEWADEVVVVDSQSTDRTAEIAESFGAEVIQFYYKSGWPKKRQWALESYNFKNDWILLLDADEILLDPIKQEIAEAIQTYKYDGYWLKFQIYFLGKQLKYGDTELWKLFLFRKNKGRYEKRLESQDASMSDIEIHEHVVVDGEIGRLKHPVRHENFNKLDRYIQKHNEYSNWEAMIHLHGNEDNREVMKPSLLGSQAQRRRWLKKTFLIFPGSYLLLFLYKYLIKLGIMDGIPGFIYCMFQAIQIFHIKAKIYELKLTDSCDESKK